MAKMIFSSF